MKNHIKKIIVFNIFLLFSIFSCTQITPSSLKTNEISFKNFNTSKIVAIRGKIEAPKKGEFSTKATIDDVIFSANVSLVYPDNHPTSPRKIIMSTVTDQNGFFTIEPSKIFNPKKGEVFVLEVFKRYGLSGKNMLSLSTNIMWDGTDWKSITADNITINTLTTAISIATNINELNLDVEKSINKVFIYSDKTIINPVGGVLSDTSVLNIEKMVLESLDSNRDPLYSVKFKNNQFYVDKTDNLLLIKDFKKCVGCDLRGLDLSNIDLENVDISKSDISELNLSGKSFKNAKISDIRAIGTNFEKADLSNLDLSRNLFQDANLNYVNLKGSKLDSLEFKNIELNNVDFTDASLKDLNVINSNLSNSIFLNADLTGTKLSQSNLSNSNFNNAILYNVTFSSSDLQGSSITSSKMKNTSFIGINLQNLDFTIAKEKTDLTFSLSNLTNANISGLTVTKSNFSDNKANFLKAEGTIFKETFFDATTLEKSNFNNAKFENSGFSRCVFTNTNFTNTSFLNTTFTGSTIQGIDFSNSNFDNSVFQTSDFYKVNFDNAKFIKSFFNSTTANNSIFTNIFTDKTLLEKDKFISCNFTKAKINGGSINGSDFSSSNFTDAEIINTNLSSVSNPTVVAKVDILSTFEKISFNKAILTRTKFRDVDQDLVTASQKNIIYADTNDLLLNKARKPFSILKFVNVDFTEANLSNVELYDTTFEKVTFKSTNITGANFYDTVFNSCTLAGMNFSKNSFLFNRLGTYHREGLDKNKNHYIPAMKFVNSNLMNANFSNSNNAYYEFFNSNLSHSLFINTNYGRIVFDGNNFIGANLSGSTFGSADYPQNSNDYLMKINFSRSSASYSVLNLNMSNFVFYNKYLPQDYYLYAYDLFYKVSYYYDNSNFRNSSITNSFILINGGVRNNNFTNSFMNGTKFFGFNLINNNWLNITSQGIKFIFCNINDFGSYFRNKDLSNAIFHSSYINNNTDFSGAILSGSNFDNTILKANFTNTNLQNTSMNESDMYSNFTNADMQNSVINNSTIDKESVFFNTNMQNAKIENSRIYNVFDSVNLTNASFSNSFFDVPKFKYNFIEGNFINTNIRTVNFSSSKYDYLASPDRSLIKTYVKCSSPSIGVCK